MVLLLAAILLPVLGGLLLFVFRPGYTLRTVFVSLVLLAQAALVALLVLTGQGSYYSCGAFIDLLPITFHIDGVGSLFVSLFTAARIIITLFSFRYMSREQGQNRFFGFWLLATGVLTGLSFAGNLLTFYLFYEMMTLSTLPLVFHEMTHEALMAGLKYLLYSIAGAFLALLGVMYLYHYDQALRFVPGGFMGGFAGNPVYLQLIAFVMILGFSCKAGLFPLHGWLPTAHPVAPAPASALLSGCITKCGVLGVIRTVYYVIGPDAIRGSWVQTTWMALALTTVFLGSMMAYREPVTKKRLAYSTVSQLSYILFGLSLLNPAGLSGALLHVVFHMAIKCGLFLCAGAIIFETGRKRVAELRGLGREMPVTCICWAGLALSLTGIPPFAGFVSKWSLAEGALAADIGVFRLLGPAVLLLSALLTAGYLFPLPVRGFFPGAGFQRQGEPAREAAPSMLLPVVILALLALLPGIFTSPLHDVIASITAGLL